jgi:hypothetical protein
VSIASKTISSPRILDAKTAAVFFWMRRGAQHSLLSFAPREEGSSQLARHDRMSDGGKGEMEIEFLQRLTLYERAFLPYVRD